MKIGLTAYGPRFGAGCRVAEGRVLGTLNILDPPPESLGFRLNPRPKPLTRYLETD